MQRAKAGAIPATEYLQRGREHYSRRAWADAFEALTHAGNTAPLDCDDLERLAMSAFLAGREPEYLAALDRLYHACLDADLQARAVRSAFWIGLCHLFRGEFGPATGWFARAHRTLQQLGRDCVEQGYLLLPAIEQQLAHRNGEEAEALAGQAAAIGERFRDADLVACARHLQGRALLVQGRIGPGLALLDEAMVAVVAGELSPRMTGLVYCSVIEKCMGVYAFARAREWTLLLSEWCEQQPQLVSFTGRCLVHRAEVMQQQGAWEDALVEARRACAGNRPQAEQAPPAAALYRLGELYRLRGEFSAAGEAYRGASGRGFEPQPGLALLRLAEGQVDASATAIRRALAATADALARLPLLGAAVEILLAAGAGDEALSAAGELEAMARKFETCVPCAIAAQARGTIELDREAAAALLSLRRAFELWQEAGLPYEAARARELIGLACHALGDEEGAGLELTAARATYAGLGAAADLARLAATEARHAAQRTHGLTKRELQVLRLVASGKTNKEIAAEICVSRRTVDRHVSNLFGKLNVATRAAATAYAHRHGLL